jgi:dTDP-4-dehydrorhamnose 3,5-epimerase
MKVIPTNIPDVLIIEPKVFGDSRGFFFESFNQKAFNNATGGNAQFVQDNHSRSAKGVLRGLHYQIQQPQGKLVRVTSGAVFDVAVDIRKSSPRRYNVQILARSNLLFYTENLLYHLRLQSHGRSLQVPKVDDGFQRLILRQSISNAEVFA